MKYFKATFKVITYSPTSWIEDGKITNRLPDMDGDYFGHVDGDLPSPQSIHNVTSQEIHSVVITELTEEEYKAAGHLVP